MTSSSSDPEAGCASELRRLPNSAAMLPPCPLGSRDLAPLHVIPPASDCTPPAAGQPDRGGETSWRSRRRVTPGGTGSVRFRLDRRPSSLRVGRSASRYLGGLDGAFGSGRGDV